MFFDKRIEEYQHPPSNVDDQSQSKLPFGEEEVNILFDSDEHDKNPSVKPFSNKPIESLVMPSLNPKKNIVKKNSVIYHDLERLYPDANISSINGFVIHRANLLGLNGVYQLFDWASDGDISVVDLKDILAEDEILNKIIQKLNDFIISDLNGEILQLSETRLLILPPSCKGMKGLEDEAFLN